MSGLIPPSVLSYIGEIAVPFIVKTFPPQSSFNEFSVPTVWIDKTAGNAYILTGKPLGVAAWVHIGGVPGEIETITTPDGAVVVPSANNINFSNGSGMSITGSGSSITFNAIGGGLSWTNVTLTTQTLAVNHAYVANNGAQVSFTLPAVSAFGDVLQIVGVGAGGWTIAQGAGQQIFQGASSSTLGAGGSVSSTQFRDGVQMVCIQANTLWQIFELTGNLAFV